MIREIEERRKLSLRPEIAALLASGFKWGGWGARHHLSRGAEHLYLFPRDMTYLTRGPFSVEVIEPFGWARYRPEPT